MQNLVEVTYKQTGNSISTNQFGMREMQQRAFEARNSKYLLIKAPPASGKSRALMFIGLDKLINQDLKKVIIAVPERSIGSSFQKQNCQNLDFLLIGFQMIDIICVLLVLIKVKFQHFVSL